MSRHERLTFKGRLEVIGIRVGHRSETETRAVAEEVMQTRIVGAGVGWEKFKSSMHRRNAAWMAFLCIVGLSCGSPDSPEVKQADELRGVTLRISVTSDSPLADALQIHVGDFEAQTGATVSIDAADTIDRSADVCIVPGSEVPTMTDLVPISNKTIQHPTMRYQELPATYRLVFSTRARETIALPISVDVMVVWYRADLFDEAKIAATYREQTGQTLHPPESWPEYVQIADFFSQHSAVQFGCVEAMDGAADAVRCFLAHCAAYSKGPHQSSFTIDTETGAARIADAGMVQGLKDWLRVKQFSPAADGTQVDAALARKLFVTGKAAMLLDHRVPTVAANGARSEESFADQIGVAPLPGAIRAASSGDLRIAKTDALNRCAQYGTGGWFVVLGSSPDRNAAERLLRFLTDAENCFYLVTASRRGLLPIRRQLLSEPHRFGSLGLSEPTVRRLFEIIQSELDADNWSADLRLQGANELHGMLASRLKSALSGELSAEGALELANDDWEAWLKPRRQETLDQYRSSLGLPPLRHQ